MYELLKAVLLDKKTFSHAFLAYTMEVVKELWPQKKLKESVGLLQASAKFEEALESLSTELLQKTKTIPFKTLAQATKVKEISFKEVARQHELLLVFSLRKGERVLETTRTQAKVLRAAYRLLHMKELLKEGFLEETQYIGTQKNEFENSAIWAFLCNRYWTDLCADLALIIDHSELVGSLNVPEATNKK
jgi:hypothetical protein